MPCSVRVNSKGSGENAGMRCFFFFVVVFFFVFCCCFLFCFFASSLVAYVISTLFTWAGSKYIFGCRNSSLATSYKRPIEI